MNYNQRFDDKSYETFNIHPSNFNHENEKDDYDCSNYGCRVKTIRETICYYPENWRNEEDKKDDCDKKKEPKHDDCEIKHPEKKERKCDDKKEENKCDDKYDDYKKYDNNHEDHKCCCRPQRRCCNLCCFRNFNW